MGNRKTTVQLSAKLFRGGTGKFPVTPGDLVRKGISPARAEKIGSEYAKLKSGMIRYHKKSSGTSAVPVPFFNAAKTANVCNNNVAGKFGDYYKVITQIFFSIFGSDAVPLITDVMKVVNNAEIDFSIGGVKYLDKVPMLPFFVALGPTSYGTHDTSYSDPWKAQSDNWDVPEVDVIYRPEEDVELIVTLNTAPANAVQITAYALGPEWVRADRA